MHHPQCVKKKGTDLIFPCASSMQICHLWTRVFSEVGYVGALQQPIPRTGLKDRSLYIKERERK